MKTTSLETKTFLASESYNLYAFCPYEYPRKIHVTAPGLSLLLPLFSVDAYRHPNIVVIRGFFFVKKLIGCLVV